MTTRPLQCDVCGRFIALSDLSAGLATRHLLTPDSALSSEQYSTLCSKHAHLDPKEEIPG